MTTVSKKQLQIFIIFTMQVLFTVSAGLLAVPIPRDNTVFPGVFINGVDIGGLTRNQAMDKLQRSFNGSEITLTLIAGDKKWDVPGNDFGVRPNIDAALDDAFGNVISNRILKAIETVQNTRKYRSINLGYNIDEKMATRNLETLSRKYNRLLRNAQIRPLEGAFRIVPEASGRQIDIPTSMEKIKEALAENGGSTIELVGNEKQPTVTVKDLKGIDNFIGVGITGNLSKGVSWSQEVESSVEAINGVVIHDGETFSFLECLKKEIPDLKKEQLSVVSTNSNGFSQVASAFYQAALYSGLTVSERKAHQNTVQYTSPGTDAMVGLAVADLKVINKTGGNVYVNTEKRDNKIVVNFLGHRKQGNTCQVSINIKKDLTRKQIVAQVIRNYYVEGLFSSKEQVSTDKYVIP